MYEIFYLDRCVGTANVKKEGMYLVLSCACRPPYDGVFRIMVWDGSRKRDLGICYPTDKNFTLRSRVPMKCLNGDSLRFTLIPNEEENEDDIVHSGKPFARLDKIDTARLELTNGQVKILIDLTPDQ